MAERTKKTLYYEYPLDQHDRWAAAAEYKGQSIKEWVRRALNEVADRHLDEAAEAERRRRSR